MKIELAQAHAHVLMVGPVLDSPLSESVFPGAPQIAVDRGIRFARHPVIWAGDGDSSPEFVPAQPELTQKTNQNETDLAFALGLIRHWSWTRLHLFGFLGKRKDHELSNLGEVCQVLKSRPSSRAIFYDSFNQSRIEMLSPGEHELVLQGPFSVMTLEKAKVSIHGECRYSAKGEVFFPLSGRGVSNAGFGKVNFSSDQVLLVIRSGEDE